MRNICISIVTHGHDKYLDSLLHDLCSLHHYIDHVIVTHNIPSKFVPCGDDYPFRLSNVFNEIAQGFAHNHNDAYKLCDSSLFCVLNPDISITVNPFPSLLTCLSESDSSLVGPVVTSPNHTIEDSARFFPTPISVLFKVLGVNSGQSNYDSYPSNHSPDWIAGMFMLFKSDVFRRIGGFDSSYYLYYEDVDICMRLRLEGYNICYCKNASVVHDAQRSSHKRFKYLVWHIKSMFLFFYKYMGRYPDRK